MSEDHTWIAMQSDPEQRRFRGVATHGNTPFDVPYISRITSSLWQGGCESGLVLPREVKHLVSLYKWEQYTVRHDLDTSLTVKMYDSLEGPDTEQLVSVASWINDCRKTGVTLVHCQAGLNRSGLVAGLSLVLSGWEPDAAISLLRETRSPAVLCNPTFEKILRGWVVP